VIINILGTVIALAALLSEKAKKLVKFMVMSQEVKIVVGGTYEYKRTNI